MIFDTPKISAELLTTISQIKCAIFDVDGVMTSGQLHYSASGEEVKIFNVLDGQGIKALQSQGIHVAVISAKQSTALERRLDDLSIEQRFLGTHQKQEAFDQLLNDLSLEAKHCCYTGDDIIDIPVMQRCHIAFSVPNAHNSVKKIADCITESRGGEGAVREICDMILYAKQSFTK